MFNLPQRYENTVKSFLAHLISVLESKYEAFNRREQLLCLHYALLRRETPRFSYQCVHQMVKCAVGRYDTSIRAEAQLRLDTYAQLAQALDQGCLITAVIFPELAQFHDKFDQAWESRVLELGVDAYQQGSPEPVGSNDLEIISSQTGASEFVSLTAFFLEHGNIVNAIMCLVGIKPFPI